MTNTGGTNSPCACGCSGQASLQPAASLDAPLPRKRLIIEFMYIDLSQCTRCQETDAHLDEALAEVATVLRATGVGVEVRKIYVQSETEARQLGFVSSPTIRINGRDIQLDLKETLCESCGEVAGEKVDCRVWTYQGQEYTSPPKGMLMEAILREAYAAPRQDTKITIPAGDVPENLQRFFSARQNKTRCCG
jgi:hypothetical protein